MSGDPGITERLRAAFAADDRGPVSGEACPDPAALWEAQHETVGAERTRARVAHLARCPTCAEEWRLAMPERARERGAEADLGGSRPLARRGLLAGLAGAAVLAAGLGVIAILTPHRLEPTPPRFRSPGPGTSIEPLVPDGGVLPRDAFVLRWTDVGPGARYSVRVHLASLEAVASARGLDRPEFRVPESALAELPSGSAIVWQVEAALPGGGRISSPTFVQRIE